MFSFITEEVILAEERTTEEEKMHIIEGKISNFIPITNYYYYSSCLPRFVFLHISKTLPC